jgi:hypothetical protein
VRSKLSELNGTILARRAMTMRSRLMRAAALMILGASVLGCSTSPVPSDPMTQSPSTTSTATRGPFAPIGLQIDARRVLDAAATGCTGGVLGGQGDVTWSYEVWTLHCPAGPGSEEALRRLVDALRAEVERLGATVDSEGEIVSGNAGNRGDTQVQLDYRFEDVETWIRVTSLQSGGRVALVVTIDHMTGPAS